MKEKEHGKGTKMAGNSNILMKGQESAKLINKELMTTKPTVSLKYPEWIHFSTKCMIKGTDQGHWDDICKLDDQMEFLFTYGIGEIVVKNGDQGYLIPGVHYAPEVTLYILSIDLLESQGIKIIYEDNTCRLVYMFSNPKDHKLNEDKLRTMQNEYLEKYFKSLKKGDTSNEGMKPVGMLSMKDDLIKIKGTIYSARVNTFNEYTARVPKQEHNPVLGMPTKIMEEGKEYTCLASHQCDFAEIKAPNMEAVSRKGKEKIEHFGIILEDTRTESDSHHFQPIQPNIKRSQTIDKDIQGMIKRPTNSHKEDTNSSSSDDFTIIT
uniref:ARID DNA-binding domain-containing protein n=1 Tax=Tanacetum cinerariifolium TaxID=118510 RepID=A0A6L2JGU3_TANCI|nr:ARID DNA-binding domain-containing protein [Tanacetum cinerariifolium]